MLCVRPNWLGYAIRMLHKSYRMNLYIDKKIKLIDSKKMIDYSETFTYYGDLEDYKYLKFSIFINENLNNCPVIDNI